MDNANTNNNSSSVNQLNKVKVLLGYVKFYPGVLGTKFYQPIILKDKESFTEADKRTRREIRNLVEENREIMREYNRELSTEGTYFEYLDCFLMDGKLLISIDKSGEGEYFADYPAGEVEEFNDQEFDDVV